MVDAIVNLVLVSLLVVPGFLLLWGFELLTGAKGRNFPDRIVRILAISFVVDGVLLIPLAPVIWSNEVQGSLWRDQSHAWMLWHWFLLAVIALPLVGLALSAVRRLVGASDPPRAWEHVFDDRPVGWIRVKLNGGGWVGGLFREGSWAAGYHEHERDLFIADQRLVDKDGAFVPSGDGMPIQLGTGVWVQGSAIEYFEIELE